MKTFYIYVLKHLHDLLHLKVIKFSFQMTWAGIRNQSMFSKNVHIASINKLKTFELRDSIDQRVRVVPIKK